MADWTATTETFTVTVDGADTYGPFPVGRVDVTPKLPSPPSTPIAMAGSTSRSRALLSTTEN